MANFSALKTAIQNAIKQNGNEEITGDVLQQILLSIVSTMGDGAINTIEQNLSNEVNTRQSADTQLQNAINAIKANIDNGYVYAGIATPSTTPVSGKVFYIATAAGTYTNFGGQVLTQGINILRFNGSAWSSQQLIGIDSVPTAGSNNLVKSGGVQNELALGAVYDVSAKNPTAGPNNDGKWESLSALFSDANLNTLIPTAYRKGGMSIKFVRTSDNKYVQARCMAQNFTTDVTQWQGVDGKPTAGSHNLVESGGVKKYISGAIQPFIKKSLDNSDNDLSISDEEGYVIAEFKNGHIRTKNFSSKEKDITLNSEASDANLSISDIGGNVILQLKGGHIKTKEFDSRNVPSNANPLKDVIWTHFGDSISTNGVYVEEGEHFYDIIAQRNGMTFSASANVVAGIGRTICYPPEGEEHRYGKIVDFLDRCLPNSTLITILAANNDFAHLVPLGQMEFSGNSIVIPSQTSECTTIVKGLCYMFNYFQTHFPEAKVVFMLPLLSSRSDIGISHAAAAGYTYQDLWDKIIEVSRFFSVEVVKLGPEVGMNPYNAEQNSLYYRDSLHPTALGQLRMANYLEQRLKIIVNN